MLTILNICLTLIVIAMHAYRYYRRASSPSTVDNASEFAKLRECMTSDAYPSTLESYTLGAETTGLFDNWHRDTVALGDICDTITQAIRYVIRHPEERERRVFVVCVCEDFVARYRDALSFGHDEISRIPWGSNWYQFSVNSTCMLAHYLILEESTSMSDVAADLILRIIAHPCKSLGYERRNVNALYMLGPWLIASLYRGKKLEVLRQHEDVRFCYALIDMRVIYGKSENGLHLDNSYLAHDGVLAFQYLFNLSSCVTSYWFPLFVDNKMNAVIENVKTCVLHPTVDRAPIGINGRKGDHHALVHKHERLGVYVMPLSRFLRFFTDRHAFYMRAQVNGIAFFESDRKIDDTAQYWVQHRAVFTKLTEKKLHFPNVGIISNASRANEPLKIESKTKTTNAFFPNEARSFVFAHADKAIVWQHYRIDEFGDYALTERVTIDVARSLIRIHAIVDNTGASELRYCGATESPSSLIEPKLEEYKIAAKSKRAIETIFSLKDDTVKSRALDDAEGDDEKEPPEKPFDDDDDYSVRVNDGFAILKHRDRPILACPIDDGGLGKTETRVVFARDEDGRCAFFEHNEISNQYEFIGRR